MTDTSEQKRFSILCEILRAQHFAWREAVREMCPQVEPAEVAARMWELTGHETARAYLKRVDPSRPLPVQIARSIVWSSRTMGEEAVVEIPDGTPGRDGEAYVRHVSCPWFDGHDRRGLLEEDRPGCDIWFRTLVEDINESLGTKLRVETLEALPEGGRCCLRKLWIED